MWSSISFLRRSGSIGKAAHCVIYFHRARSDSEKCVTTHLLGRDFTGPGKDVHERVGVGGCAEMGLWRGGRISHLSCVRSRESGRLGHRKGWERLGPNCNTCAPQTTRRRLWWLEMFACVLVSRRLCQGERKCQIVTFLVFLSSRRCSSSSLPIRPPAESGCIDVLSMFSFSLSLDI